MGLNLPITSMGGDKENGLNSFAKVKLWQLWHTEHCIRIIFVDVDKKSIAWRTKIIVNGGYYV